MPLSSLVSRRILGGVVCVLLVVAGAQCSTGTAAVVIASVSVTATANEVVVGETLALAIAVTDQNGAAVSGVTPSWSSNDDNLATVNASGIVTGVAPGPVVITATVEGVSGMVSLTVMPVPVHAVVVTPASTTIAVGGTVQISASPVDAEGVALTGRPVTWASGNPSVATVSATGLVDGVAIGAAAITATSEGIDGTSTVTVSGTDTSPPTVSNGMPTGTLAAGTTQATLSVDTDENATCGFSLTPGTAFNAMTVFSNTGGTNHTTVVTGLTDGQGFTYHVRCEDGSGNANTTDFNITFSVDAAAAATIFLEEGFEDQNFASRGWFNNINLPITTDEQFAGASALEAVYNQNSTTPVGINFGSRFTIPVTESVFISYYVKYSANWVGSQTNSHPHEFLFMTNKNMPFDPPAFSFLSVNVEHNYVAGQGGVPAIRMADGANIDHAAAAMNPRPNLVGVTENRGAHGCNGDADALPTSCFVWVLPDYNNTKSILAPQATFTEMPGTPGYKNDWHFVEAYIQLNTVQGGVGQVDGIVQYWFDGTLIIDEQAVLLRTGEHPDMMFERVIFGPFIGGPGGNGSPVTQTMWIDELTVANRDPVP